MARSKDSLEAVFESIGLLTSDDTGPEELKPITLWVPIRYKEKYEKLQQVTRRKFGKLAKQVFIKTLDKVDVEAI